MPIINDDEFGKITVRRSHKASQIRIRVTASGGLYASLPSYAPMFLVRHLVKTSRPTLRKMLNTAQPKYDYTNGSTIGKSHRLIIYQDASEFSVKLSNRRIIINTPSPQNLANPDAIRKIRSTIANALRLEAKSYLPKRVSYLAQQNGFEYDRLRFSHASGRWGSCSTNGTISLNIAIMKLPFELIDYVIVHELAHTQEMNHGSEFWSIVGSIFPDYRIRRHELKKYNPSI